MCASPDELSRIRAAARYTATVPLFLLVLLASACGSASQSVTGPSSTKCALSATADAASFPPAGGTGTLTISTNRECQWNVRTTSGWIQLNGSTSGQGEARVPFTVAVNGDPARRQGTVSVGDQQISISQEPAPCQFTLEPSTVSVPPSGGRGSIRVGASSPQCSWTARSETSWLAIIDGAQGTGSGEVVYEARAGDGPPRTGTLTVADHSIPVTQGDGCAPALSASTQNVAASGGSGAVTVSVGEGCPWSAVSQAAWIAVTSGAAGTGRGEVRFNVGANISPERSAALSIAGQTFTVTQASGCSVAIAPTSQVFTQAGGPGSISLTVGSGCPWSASISAGWIQITGAASGAGPGTVSFAVAANSGPAREASLTVGGRVFAVQQHSGCSYALSAPGIIFQPAGGGGTVHVLTADGCSWTASTPGTEPWFQISAGRTGTGTGPVNFWALPNDGPERSGILTAAGQPFSVRQLSGCTVSIDPTGQTVGAQGGSGSIAVTAGAGCPWTAIAQAEWLAVVEGTAGTGAGIVQFTVQPNAGPPRSSLILVGGQAFSVTQTGQ